MGGSRVTPGAPRHEPAVIFAYKKLFMRDNLPKCKIGRNFAAEAVRRYVSKSQSSNWAYLAHSTMLVLPQRCSLFASVRPEWQSISAIVDDWGLGTWTLGDERTGLMVWQVGPWWDPAQTRDNGWGEGTHGQGTHQCAGNPIRSMNSSTGSGTRKNRFCALTYRSPLCCSVVIDIKGWDDQCFQM